ncbi:phosphonate ABC transporter ATP-binding protein [Pelovirga terrestris]|uniref:Phosphonate ABC transporter ATP-binding protein n=1 Tax=Pelovirga terrestris TaxID=2771352 RepID=A0A8J6UPP9_9BACT|nr:phosphonate ABC transporter ATP-binding protein [Pelovirga terrestris]MBD1400874.1 phosphonate ABC transporter ATP-binding protein [Pelovirga terrestris]
MIQFEALTKQFADGTLAMHNINLEIPKGQFCVLLGPSGAGKSTLLRSLNGLVEPTSGRIIFAGRPITGRQDLLFMRRRVAMVHQSFNLVPRLTVLTNVLCGLLGRASLIKSLLGVFPREQKHNACRLIESVGLSEEHVYRKASGLSGGQQQRVGIARAFIGDPEVVLADEPVASLDPRISRDIMQLLRNASQARNATVLCSLHQVDLAREFADRIVAMKTGRVVFDGSPSDLTDEVLGEIYGDEQSGSRQAEGASTIKGMLGLGSNRLGEAA